MASGTQSTMYMYSWNKYIQYEPTLWCLKYALREKQDRPMLLNIWSTLEAEPPETKMAKHNKKFPAGILVPTISGWLLHTFSGEGQLVLVHTVFISTMVPISLLVTVGFPDLQTGHTLNNNNSFDKKTINFGCFRRLDSKAMLKEIKR